MNFTPEDLKLIENELLMPRDELLAVILEYRRKDADERHYRIENGRVLEIMSKDYKALEARLAEMTAENERLRSLLAHTADVAALRTDELFGRGTEKLSDVLSGLPAQAEIDEAEEEPAEEPAVAPASGGRGKVKTSGKTTVKKGKRAGKREEDLSKLPQEQRFLLDIEALDKQYGAGNWRIAFWHGRSTLQVQPAQPYALNTYTPVISVGLEHALVNVPSEPALWPNSFASASAVALILYLKFAMAVPIYRQERMFRDFGFPISRQTMNNWVLYFASVFFGPIFDHMETKLLEVPYHQCDESPLRVNKDGRKAGSRSYMWIHTTGELSGALPIVLFCFELTRNTEHLRKFYKDFEGFISCDGYCSYKLLAKEKGNAVVICGCMMHMRRRFVDALTLMDRSGMDENEVAELPAAKALAIIGEIYDADEPLKSLTADERKLEREKSVKPLVDKFYEYIEGMNTEDPSMSARMKDAVCYAQNQKEYLCRFLTDGHIPLDNGHCERSLRGYTIARSNFLFCDSIAGAEAAAIMFSVTGTARANGANVYWYLRYVLEKMVYHQDDNGKDKSYLDALMPWAPEYLEYQEKHTSTLEPPPEANVYTERPRTPRKNRGPTEAANLKTA